MLIYQYLNCKIQPNHYIDELTAYLATIENNNIVSKDITTPKAFLSDEESFSIRIEVLDKVNFPALNYVKLFVDKEGDLASISRYYFVTGKQCVSENIYDLQLQLDVVNTYQNQISNVDNFKQVTITRRHKNRFKQEANTNRFYRVFDKVDEGLGTVPMTVENAAPIGTVDNQAYVVTKTLAESDDLHLAHNLLVNNLYLDTAKNIWCNCYEKTDVSLDDTSNTQRAIFIYGEEADTLITAYLDLVGYQGRYCCANAILLKSNTASGSNTHLYLGYIENDRFVVETDHDYSRSQKGLVMKAQGMKADGNFKILYTTNNSVWNSLSVGQSYSINQLLTNTTQLTSTLSSIQVTVPSIKNVNKVDSNIKSIAVLPCRPTNRWYSLLGITVKDLAVANETISLNNITYIDDDLLISKPAMTRDFTYESKLYGSYVKNYQIVYDSFSLPVQPEYLVPKATALNCAIYKPIDMTNDVALKVENLQQQELNSNVISCNRNNNLPVFTNEYLNYIRNGYNYDQKAQSLANIKNAISASANVVGASVNLHNMSQMGTLGVYSGIQAGVNTAVSLTNAIISGIENDSALKQKRLDLLNTSPSMTGSDNYLLFQTINGGNCFKFVTSKPAEDLLESIENLFYYSGYADNLNYNTMPNIKTREYFNYLQCKVDYCTITDPKIRQRLVNALSSGVTYEWHYNNTWLMKGELYENWETVLS